MYTSSLASTTNTYYEPFVDGGAVFFDLLPKNAELSDLNNELVPVCNVIKNNVDELIQSLQKHIYDKEYYLEVRAKKVEDMSDVEIASCFILLNRTGFNGLSSRLDVIISKFNRLFVPKYNYAINF